MDLSIHVISNTIYDLVFCIKWASTPLSYNLDLFFVKLYVAVFNYFNLSFTIFLYSFLSF